MFTKDLYTSNEYLKIIRFPKAVGAASQWWSNGLLQANDGKMLVNDGEMLVNDGEMSVWTYTHFTIIDEHLITIY